MTPKGLMSELRYDLKKGPTQKHRVVVQAIQERLRMSERRMRERYEQMNRNEERFQAFIPESENDAIRRGKRDSGEPTFRTIEVPYTYATLMTAHTYYTSVFLSRSPVFQVTARHGETEMQTQGLEAVLDYQRQVGEMMVPLFIWLLDPGKYGFGVIGHYWDEQYITKRSIVEMPGTFLGLELPGLKPVQEEQVEKVYGYCGNRIYNVRPHDWLPDPRVSMKYFQKGEFVGRYVENSWFDILAGEGAGKYFNVDTLRYQRDNRDASLHFGAGGVVERGEESQSSHLPADTAGDWALRVPPGFVKSWEIYVRLIPKEWGFGSETDPEIWVLTVSANGVLYGAEPLGEDHGMFPFNIIEAEVDGYNLFSRSMLEVAEPMNDIITWLLNAHMYNVRQTLYNQFIVDPSMVVMKDLEDPEAGKLIRLKPEAYGRDVRTILTQLQTVDVTKQHFQDLEVLEAFIQRCTGVTDATMGMLPQKSHTTATAVRTSTSFGVNRMKTQCEYFSAMGFSPFTQMMIQRTQQRMKLDKMYRIVGDLAQFGKPFVQVDSQTISGFFDYVPVDGTMPVDRFAQANLWQQILGQLRNFPQIMMTYDIAKIFAWVANLAGVKNMAQFRVVPDQMLQQQAQAGNVIPLASAMKDQGMRTNLNEPGQVPNVGATG